jgi:hypothetical protein
MIIGLSGFGRAGKNTVADYLSENFGYKQISFADPIKKALYALNPIVLDGLEDSSVKELVDVYGWEQAKENSEVRRLLQVFGTEVGREMFGQYVWIEKALGNAEPFDRIVIPDVRFPDEALAIKNLFGEVWRINRGTPINGHISENALNDWAFDAYFDNNGTIDDLTGQAGAYLHLYFDERNRHD